MSTEEIARVVAEHAERIARSYAAPGEEKMLAGLIRGVVEMAMGLDETRRARETIERLLAA